MAHQGLPCLSSPLQPNTDQVKRPHNDARQSVRYHHSVWGDYFLNSSQDPKKVEAWTSKVEGAKPVVRKMLINARGTEQEMTLIEDIQRLGIAYHFEKEIDDALNCIFNEYAKVDYDDLYIVALRFRLLRQGGYRVSPDVFLNFKDQDGSFKASLSSNIKGMLSLYEASYLGIQREDILDEAIEFTTGSLKSAIAHLHSPLSEMVRRALELPLNKRIPRVEARSFISLYQEDDSRNRVLLELAKADFNLLQSLHQRELKDLTRWWKELGLATKCSFARDRLVEGYLWSLGIYFEPQYTWARAILTKIVNLATTLDDIFDAYGTLDELEILTSAFHRWEVKAADLLPDYMKPCYLATLNCVDEIEDRLMPDEKVYRTNFLKRETKVLVQAYLDEAKWKDRRYVPMLAEHLKVSLPSSVLPLLTGAAYVSLGKEATKEVFDWLSTHPKFVVDSATIGRLADDIAGHRFEQEREHVPSTIECYVKEHGVSEEEACAKLREMIAMGWKGINEACLRPTAIPRSLLLRGANFPRVCEEYYIRGDAYTHSSDETKEKIIALLVESIPM